MKDKYKSKNRKNRRLLYGPERCKKTQRKWKLILFRLIIISNFWFEIGDSIRNENFIPARSRNCTGCICRWPTDRVCGYWRSTYRRYSTWCICGRLYRREAYPALKLLPERRGRWNGGRARTMILVHYAARYYHFDSMQHAKIIFAVTVSSLLQIKYKISFLNYEKWIILNY